eukprot:7434473-Alexandrium_andersonii.AAC.1
MSWAGDGANAAGVATIAPACAWEGLVARTLAQTGGRSEPRRSMGITMALRTKPTRALRVDRFCAPDQLRNRVRNGGADCPVDLLGAGGP